MNIFTKLLTAVRGAGNELGEKIVDTQALRILEQEINKATNHLDHAKENLTEVLAYHMISKRKLKTIEEKISQYEEYAVKALNKKNEDLALEIATKIAKLNSEYKNLFSIEQNYSSQISTLKQTIASAENSVKAVDRELTLVKTTENIHKANKVITQKLSNTDSSLSSSTDSLSRIKAKQQKTTDHINATLETQQSEQDSALLAKLQQAGILENLKSKQNI